MVTKESKKLQFFSIFSSQIQFYYVYLVEHVDQTGIFPKKRGRLPEK